MSLMSRIVAKQLGANDSEPSNGAPATNPILASLMKQFGVSPDEIKTFAESLKTQVVEVLTKIETRLVTIENRLTEIESNQMLLMKDHESDGEIARMVENCNTVMSDEIIADKAAKLAELR